MIGGSPWRGYTAYTDLAHGVSVMCISLLAVASLLARQIDLQVLCTILCTLSHSDTIIKFSITLRGYSKPLAGYVTRLEPQLSISRLRGLYHLYVSPTGGSFLYGSRHLPHSPSS